MTQISACGCTYPKEQMEQNRVSFLPARSDGLHDLLIPRQTLHFLPHLIHGQFLSCSDYVSPGMAPFPFGPKIEPSNPSVAWIARSGDWVSLVSLRSYLRLLAALPHCLCNCQHICVYIFWTQSKNHTFMLILFHPVEFKCPISRCSGVFSAYKQFSLFFTVRSVSFQNGNWSTTKIKIDLWFFYNFYLCIALALWMGWGMPRSEGWKVDDRKWVCT